MHVYIEAGIPKSCHENNLRLFSIDVPVSGELSFAYSARKLAIIKSWSSDMVQSLRFSDYASVIDDAVWQAYGEKLLPYLEPALPPVSNLHLILSTRLAYDSDIVGDLRDYLAAKGFKPGLLDAFVTVCMELINNAVLHGNLGLNLDFNVSEDEVVGYTHEAFQLIAQHLDTPALALRPVVITLNIHDQTLTLDVQDQGQGFDFDLFKEKYKYSKLQKGMDLVFLLSRDISYDRLTRTMSVIIDDPDSMKHQRPSINFAPIPVGILTNNPRYYALVSTALHEAGFREVRNLLAMPHELSAIVDKLSAVIALQDKDGQLPMTELVSLRAQRDSFSLPILCQKYAQTQRNEPLYALANDFLSSPLNVLEIVQRTKAQISLVEARHEMMSFTQNYQVEIRQAEKTIRFLEQPCRQEWPMMGHSVFDARIIGTPTAMNLNERFLSRYKETNLLYGQGIAFSIAGKPFLLLVTLPEGLSSVLVLSYLKGYIQRLKDMDQEYSPASIIALISSYIAALIPSMMDLQLLCLCSDIGGGRLLWQRLGQYSVFQFTAPALSASVVPPDSIGFDGTHYFMPVTSATNLLILDARCPVEMASLPGLLRRYLNNGPDVPSEPLPPAFLLLSSPEEAK